MRQEKELVVFCPKCKQESMVVEVTDSGQGFHPEFGPEYWFTGIGKCPCGYVDEHYGDSSL